MSLREDLLTKGWSIIPAHEWVERLQTSIPWTDLENMLGWYASEAAIAAGYVLMPALADSPIDLQNYVNEMDRLLHDALPDEDFYFCTVELRTRSNALPAHTDVLYLRTVLACKGAGAIVVEQGQRISVPSGCALVITGTDRRNATQIPETLHSSPEKRDNRQVVVISFRLPIES